ncbi:MAG: hypothetical protein WD928_13505 [Gammaproteobacteria bacterium]
MNWSRYIRRLLGMAAAMAGALYAFILVLDPYQNVPFSPSLERAPVATNQRFSFPAIARDPAFDALVIGTSTSRLLDPLSLGGLTSADFANLAMNSATAYEQQRIHALFVRHHPELRYLVLGVDEAWCTRAAEQDQYTFRAFPEWMYDDNPWNDLIYLFNDKALEQAVRMLELVLGWREPKYRRDGYRDFTADFGAYDPAAVAHRLYQRPARGTPEAAVWPARAREEWHYPLLDDLAALLARTPRDTRVVLFFPPLHAHYIERQAETFAECKGRVLDLAADRGGVAILDYLYVSPLTLDDGNYWDPLHFTRAVSQEIETDAAAALTGRQPESAHVRYYPRAQQPES